MNEDLVLAITMLIILAVVVLFIQISQQIKVKRIQKMKIQRRFGEIPDMEEVLPIERISVYHKHQGMEDVDQVTWSDLSMDQVFQRIDQCDSAAGEAVLYNMLHCTDNGQAQWKDLLKYYEEQAEPRKKAEAILISLGKREGLYYLPEYVDTLQASHVGSVFFYRLLQILLLGSIVGGLWNIQILPLAGVMAIVNIAVYIMTRMKYEQQMSMMELIVLVIDAGKRLTKEKCAGPVQKELEEKLKELGKLDKLIGKMSAMRRNSYSSDQGVFLDYLFGITLWQLISYEKSVKWLENKLCIIDEILKGTNTKERIAASKAILDYMQRQNCLVMVASHDYELTVLLEGTYENYHFTERIGEDDIYFDYRLYPGAVTFGNAIKLLKFMKFPEEIVTEAKQQVTMELADLQ